MSIHLITRAAEISGLRASHKLVLLCLAEDARDPGSRLCSPGTAAMMRWSGLSRSRLFVALKELQGLRLLIVHEAGHRGRHTRYQVLPEGCCPTHGRPDESRLQDSSVRVDSPADGTHGGRMSLVPGRISPVSVPGESRVQDPSRPTPLQTVPTGSSRDHPLEPDWSRWHTPAAIIDLAVRRARRQPLLPFVGQHVEHAVTIMTGTVIFCHDCAVAVQVREWEAA